MAKIDAVIIRQSSDESTVALVSAECDSEMIDGTDGLCGAIMAAVTKWAQDGDGKEVHKNNRGTINVGDLHAECLGDPALTALLGAEGVTDLQITTHVGDATSWDYDLNLYDQACLDE